MKRFYNLLVRDLSTDTDPDLDKIRKSNTADIKAIRNEFRNSKSFKINLAMTCVLKFILSLLFGIWICYLSYGTIYTRRIEKQPKISTKNQSEQSDDSPTFSYIDYILCILAEVSNL